MFKARWCSKVQKKKRSFCHLVDEALYKWIFIECNIWACNFFQFLSVLPLNPDWCYFHFPCPLHKDMKPADFWSVYTHYQGVSAQICLSHLVWCVSTKLEIQKKLPVFRWLMWHHILDLWWLGQSLVMALFSFPSVVQRAWRWTLMTIELRSVAPKIALPNVTLHSVFGLHLYLCNLMLGIWYCFWKPFWFDDILNFSLAVSSFCLSQTIQVHFLLCLMWAIFMEFFIILSEKSWKLVTLLLYSKQ